MSKLASMPSSARGPVFVRAQRWPALLSGSGAMSNWAIVAVERSWASMAVELLPLPRART